MAIEHSPPSSAVGPSAGQLPAASVGQPQHSAGLAVPCTAVLPPVAGHTGTGPTSVGTAAAADVAGAAAVVVPA